MSNDLPPTVSRLLQGCTFFIVIRLIAETRKETAQLQVFDLKWEVKKLHRAENGSKALRIFFMAKVYHSSFVDEEGISKACGCPLLPLKSHVKGPAPVSDQDRTDIVDEAITFFRANVFFRNFELKSLADKLLIYLTFYINVALKRLEGCRTLAEGTKAIINLGLEKVSVPGEPGFPFPGLFTPPQSQEEAVLFRNYLKQIREETSGRLLSVAYRPNGTPNKWWLAFAKRKFMNIIIP